MPARLLIQSGIYSEGERLGKNYFGRLKKWIDVYNNMLKYYYQECETIMSESVERVAKASRIEAMGRNLTVLARENKITLGYGRIEQISEIIAYLSSGENNLILVGPSGVGKNNLIESLAVVSAKAHQKQIDQNFNLLSNKMILETNTASFQVGCFYVHDYENKVERVVAHCKENNVIMFIDDINLAVGAGSITDNPERTLANLLTPYITSGAINIIGATTPEGYERMLKTNPVFVDRFVKMEVTETSPAVTREILLNIKRRYERKYKLLIDDSVFDSIIELSERFLPGQCFPGKAIRLLGESAATKESGEKKVLESRDVYELVRKKTGLPESLMMRDRDLEREEVRDFFRARLFGQDNAIEAVVDTIMTYKAELNDTGKPVGTFLFTGPTGVGKTELAKLLAEYLFGSQQRLHRYDMSNYADYDGVRRLLGGESNSDVGMIYADIMAAPCSVTLFDEIEKAHPAVYNVLLTLLDEGKLVDKFGRVSHFYNSIVIMTSNTGSDLYTKRPITVSPALPAVTENDIFRRVKETFSPEFINRIGNIVYFKELNEENIRNIAKKLLEETWQRRGVTWRNLEIVVDDAMLDMLVRDGYSREYGARAMQRIIMDRAVNPLARLLSSESGLVNKVIRLKIATDGEVAVELAGDKEPVAVRQSQDTAESAPRESFICVHWNWRNQLTV